MLAQMETREECRLREKEERSSGVAYKKYNSM